MSIVYCDGSCLGNPGRGGWAAVCVEQDRALWEISGRDPMTTNNRMELKAACMAIERAGDCTIYTDSMYVQQGITVWIRKWEMNGWKTANRSPVKNEDLWKELRVLCKKHSVNWEWVKGHHISRWNIRADELARIAANP